MGLRKGGLLVGRENQIARPAPTKRVTTLTAKTPQRRVRLGAAAVDSLPKSDSSLRSSRATFKSAIFCQRRSGALRRQRVMILSSSAGMLFVNSVTRLGSLFRIAASVDIFESP